MRAFVFPGQGAQTIGMGRALADAYPAARAVFEEVDEALGEGETTVKKVLVVNILRYSDMHWLQKLVMSYTEKQSFKKMCATIISMKLLQHLSVWVLAFKTSQNY